MHNEGNSCWDTFVVRGALFSTVNHQLPFRAFAQQSLTHTAIEYTETQCSLTKVPIKTGLL